MTTPYNARAEAPSTGLRAKLAGAADSLQTRAAGAGSRLHDEFDRAADTGRDLARSARRSAVRGGRRAVSEVRQRPISFGLAAVVGVAAIALLAIPRTRKLALAGAPLLWNEFQKRRGSLHL